MDQNGRIKAEWQRYWRCIAEGNREQATVHYKRARDLERAHSMRRTTLQILAGHRSSSVSGF